MSIVKILPGTSSITAKRANQMATDTFLSVRYGIILTVIVSVKIMNLCCIIQHSYNRSHFTDHTAKLVYTGHTENRPIKDCPIYNETQLLLVAK